MTTSKTTATTKRPAKSKKPMAERKRSEQKKELAKLRDYLLKESIVMLAADLYQDIYNSSQCDGWTDACEQVIELAKQFEKKLKWNIFGDEDRDYIEELEKFEQEVRSRLQIL